MVQRLDKHELDLQIQYRLIERLSRSESRYQSLVENVQEVVFQIDGEFKFLFLNKAWTLLTGISVETALGQPLSNFLSKSFQDVWRDLIADVLNSSRQEASLAELCLAHTDGSPRWVTFVMQRQKSEGNWVGSMHDVTGDKDAEILRRQHRQLSIVQKAQSTFISDGNPYHLFNSFLPDILDLTDSQFGFIGELTTGDNAQNLSIYAMHNTIWDKAERSHHEERVSHGFELVTSNPLFGDVIHTGKSIISNNLENDPKAADLPSGFPPLSSFLGAPIYYGARLIGMFGLANRSGGYNSAICERLGPVVSTCAQLLTAVGRERERQESARLLQQATYEAKRANEHKSEFLANMSHELRTPMHAILSFAKFGIKKCAAADVNTIEEYFRTIHSSGDRLLGLLNDLLDLAKLESGAMVLTYTPCDFREVVERTRNELRPLLDNKDISLKVDVNTENTEAVFDKLRMIQVLINLISNSIKFSNNGGAITVTLCEQLLADGSEALCCAVGDEGPGIPESELNAVFDKFVQSSKTKSGAGGTGLGLSICHEILKAHGGRIWAENRQPKGALFSFVIPRRKSAAPRL
jgi:PAS domain S-box-containing protein